MGRKIGKKLKGKQASSPKPTPTWLTISPLYYTYWIKKKNSKAVAIKVNKQANIGGTKQVWVSKGDYFNHEEHQEHLDPKWEMRSLIVLGTWF